MSNKRIKCTVISDTHSAHEELRLPGGDILFHCGDATYLGQPDEVYPFLKWLHEQNYTHKVLIAGNHDFGFEDTEIDRHEGYMRKNKKCGHLRNEYMRVIEQYGDIHYLECDSVEIMGYKIWGSPYTPEFNNWAFSYGPCIRYEPYTSNRYACNASVTNGQMYDYYDSIPFNVDIIMTHGPALGILDKNNSYGSMYGDNRLGCDILRDRINRIQNGWGAKSDHTLYHLFGHIHERGGQRHYKRGKDSCSRNLVSINAAVCGIPYQFHNHDDGINFYLPRREDDV